MILFILYISAFGVLDPKAPKHKGRDAKTGWLGRRGIGGVIKNIKYMEISGIASHSTHGTSNNTSGLSGAALLCSSEANEHQHAHCVLAETKTFAAVRPQERELSIAESSSSW